MDITDDNIKESQLTVLNNKNQEEVQTFTNIGNKFQRVEKDDNGNYFVTIKMPKGWSIDKLAEEFGVTKETILETNKDSKGNPTYYTTANGTHYFYTNDNVKILNPSKISQEIPDEQFVERYLEYCNGKDVVVCGGTLYYEKRPQRDYLLRWTYGMKNEVQSALVRNKHPNDNFQAFNFLIHRNLFMNIRFNELLKNYGYEDTLFRFELTKRDIQVIHIDNPLYHIGIDSNLVYLEKTRQGVENLTLLMESPESQKLICHMRLLRYYQVFKKTRTVFVVFGIFLIFRRLILHNLNGYHPNMALFNFYKLGYLCSLKYNKI
mgnify:CR=1 FL=1